MTAKERRHHDRYRLWLPARLEGAAERLAVGHDMSQKGSRLVTNGKLDIGELIQIHVRIPPDAAEERAISARVVRCEVNESDPNGLWPYEIAVEFLEVHAELEALLREQTSVLEGITDSE
jgi:PilZ domain-containing protein